MDLPPVIGHRGAAARAPENTVPGFRRAAADGAGWVEADARLTADGAVVLLHDSTLDRTTNGSGALARAPLAAVRALDAGAWFDAASAGTPVPTLAEAVAALTGLGLGLNLELKPVTGGERALARAVVEVLAAAWPPRRPPPLVASFEPAALAEMAALAPSLPRGYLTRGGGGWRNAAARLGCATVHMRVDALTPRLVAAIRSAGYPVVAWTVNDPDTARHLWDAGVMSVITDDPGALTKPAHGAI